MPEHLHCIWKLPEDDADYSIRWSMIKGLFTRRYRLRTKGPESAPVSHRRKGEACIWQRRFWEHRIRDERDLYRHINYIHSNPIKHGLVKRLEDWPWSTFHRYVREGFYGRIVNLDDDIGCDPIDFGE